MEILQRLLSLIQSLFKKTSQADPKVILPEPKADPGSLLIRHYEGCKLSPYADIGGVATIGWGNTVWEDGKPVSLTDKAISQSRANALFEFWHKAFKARVSAALPIGTKDNELAAYTSLAYNIGFGAFHGSTTLKCFLLGDKAKAGASIEWWNKVKGETTKGLQRRRRAEHLVFDGMAVSKAIAQAELDYP